ncbi:unnamed protein product [Peronospora belbahrii]|uniref:Uncharacterized protein n=1 Tax=Peronospora belbahrii TaxID=622444 RepID=A0AAU9KZQ4_9STRA|nr:unnamed protein product [Peronospora belbahrii]CAH0515392.1 unnamed protein product [Peronospora belbahrii]
MELSPEDCDHCHDVTKQLLDITLHDCQELGLERMYDANQACLDKKRWKRLQSHSEFTVYADRNANSAWLPTMSRQDWEYPIAVTAVGRMNCTLDDVLFALLTPNAATQRLRDFLMDRNPGKNCQFIPIEMPTQEAPFQFLAVTRFITLNIWPFTMFKAPREMVVAFATGDMTTANGKRYAYEMAQSVELQCKGTQNSLKRRSRALQSRIFWEQRDGSIAVYTKLIVDAKICISDSVKQIMLGRAVMGFWKFVPRSLETKKLWWCVRNKKRLIAQLQIHSQSQRLAEVASCKGKLQGKEIAASRCEFCDRKLCSGPKCCTSCHLKMVLSNETGILEQTLTLCPRCAAFVRALNAVDIARALLVESERTSYGSGVSITKTSSANKMSPL